MLWVPFVPSTPGPRPNANRVPNSADLTPGNPLEPPRIWLYRAKPSAQAPTFNPKVGGSILHGPPAAEAPPTRFGWNRPAGWARADDGRPNPLSRRVRQTWNGVVGTVMLPPELL
jgi:hypothetical protein